jgi:hypothetical protein
MIWLYYRIPLYEFEEKSNKCKASSGRTDNENRKFRVRILLYCSVEYSQHSSLPLSQLLLHNNVYLRLHHTISTLNVSQHQPDLALGQLQPMNLSHMSLDIVDPPETLLTPLALIPELDRGARTSERLIGHLLQRMHARQQAPSARFRFRWLYEEFGQIRNRYRCRSCSSLRPDRD